MSRKKGPKSRNTGGKGKKAGGRLAESRSQRRPRAIQLGKRIMRRCPAVREKQESAPVATHPSEPATPIAVSPVREEAKSARSVADPALSRLDPLLMLGAFNAPDEFVSVPQDARLEAAPPVEAARGDEIGLGPLLTGAAVALPLGMRSLAAHMTGPALKSFLVDDLVPVLVNARGHERVLEQIRTMEGTAEALPQTNTLLSRCRERG